MKSMPLLFGLVFIISIGLAGAYSAYYTNPYVKQVSDDTTTQVKQSIGTQGGFKLVLNNRNSLGQQIAERYTRKTIQGYTPYSQSKLPAVRKGVNQGQYYVLKNDFNQYRNPLSYADETLKIKLTKMLGIKSIFDPARGKNVLIETMPTTKLVELLSDPRSRTETFRGSDVDVDAVLNSLGLGQGAFVPKNKDDNLKY